MIVDFGFLIGRMKQVIPQELEDRRVASEDLDAAILECNELIAIFLNSTRAADGE